MFTVKTIFKSTRYWYWKVWFWKEYVVFADFVLNSTLLVYDKFFYDYVCSSYAFILICIAGIFWTKWVKYDEKSRRLHWKLYRWFIIQTIFFTTSQLSLCCFSRCQSCLLGDYTFLSLLWCSPAHLIITLLPLPVVPTYLSGFRFSFNLNNISTCPWILLLTIF